MKTMRQNSTLTSQLKHACIFILNIRHANRTNVEPYHVSTTTCYFFDPSSSVINSLFRKNSRDIKCKLWYFPQNLLSWNSFQTTKNSARDHKKTYTCLHVNCLLFLSDFNQNEFGRQILVKCPM